jgi:hypothetical protein
LKSILKRIESRYKVKLPKKVVMVDYGERDDLYMRFKHVQRPLGDQSDDSRVIFFYDDGKIVGLEILHLKYFID